MGTLGVPRSFVEILDKEGGKDLGEALIPMNTRGLQFFPDQNPQPEPQARHHHVYHRWPGSFSHV